jgi:hypothetical protein
MIAGARPARSVTVGICALVLALLSAACGNGAGAPVTSQTGNAAAPRADSGVSLARNSGPTLVVLSLDPAAPGDNGVRVDLRDPLGAVIPGSVRVDLVLDGSAAAPLTLPAAERQTLTVAHRGHADLRVTVLDGKSSGANADFALDLPVERAADDTLAAVDAAMQGLHSLREMQTLTSGGPELLFHFEYEAPDLVRYTMIGPSGKQQETRLIGRDRYDRDAGGAWTQSDLGFGSRVPYSAFARGATRVRVVGRGQDGAQELLDIAFVQSANVYYRISVGAQDHLVRSYTMMTKGHYMTGAYSDYDGPVAISAP